MIKIVEIAVIKKNLIFRRSPLVILSIQLTMNSRPVNVYSNVLSNTTTCMIAITALNNMDIPLKIFTLHLLLLIL